MGALFYLFCALDIICCRSSAVFVPHLYRTLLTNPSAPRVYIPRCWTNETWCYTNRQYTTRIWRNDSEQNSNQKSMWALQTGVCSMENYDQILLTPSNSRAYKSKRREERVQRTEVMSKRRKSKTSWINLTSLLQKQSDCWVSVDIQYIGISTRGG